MVFAGIKTSSEFWRFLYAQNLLAKKTNWLEIVMIASFTILLMTSYLSTIKKYK